MPSTATRMPERLPLARESADRGIDFLLSPWLWAPALTVGFYQALPRLPFEQTFLNRYFCSHWTLYCEIACFFLGMCILARKGIGLRAESRVLRLPVLEQSELAEHTAPSERAAQLWQTLGSVPAGFRRTKLLERIGAVCEYVVSRKSTQSLEQHLRYLADMAADGLSSSYALVRTITWAIPILGFLGTVIGITMAIANITPEQLETSLTGVTAGLAVAFDTTALALTLSMILVFSTFIIERSENRILSDVEEFGIAELAPALGTDAPAVNPLASAEAQAADQLLKRTEALITWQTDLWQSALESLRGRWLETAEQQQTQFAQVLQQGMSSTLNSHQQQLAEARTELIGGCRLVAQEMARAVDGLQQSAARQQQQFAEEVQKVWGRLHHELAQSQADQAARTAQSVTQLTEAIDGWHGDLSQASTALTNQLVELQRQGEILRDLVAGEAELTRLQGTLRDNLEAVRATQTFEESIHSLNAAVHLLTARARPHAA